MYKKNTRSFYYTYLIILNYNNVYTYTLYLYFILILYTYTLYLYFILILYTIYVKTSMSFLLGCFP